MWSARSGASSNPVRLSPRLTKGKPAALGRGGPGVPPGSGEIVRRGPARAPNARSRNVAELAQELEPFGPDEIAGTLIRHIKSIVREGGASVRPPTPFP